MLPRRLRNIPRGQLWGQTMGQQLRGGIGAGAVRGWVGQLAVLLAGSAAASARGSHELRYFGLDTFNASSRTSSDDLFANGTPTTGLVFQTPTGPVAGVYGPGVGVFSAGAERPAAGADWLGQQFGVGGLSFRYADAVDNTTNLTPAPFQARSLSLATTAVPGTALGLVDSQRGFNVLSLWSFSSLAAGESLMLGLGGTSNSVGTDGGGNYRDRLQIRYTANLAGTSFLNFELQSRQDGVFTRNALASRSLASLPVDLSQVDYLLLQLEREAPTAGNPNPGVSASVSFMDAAYDAVNDSPVVLYGFTFSVLGATFVDNRFSAVFNAANWLDPEPSLVPEPSTAALWLAGLLWLGRRAGRAQAASGGR